MSFRIVQVEFDSVGLEAGRLIVSDGISDVAEARSQAEQLANEFRERGYKGEPGYWWVKNEEGKIFHLIVEGEPL
jgi:hypothetical protein